MSDESTLLAAIAAGDPIAFARWVSDVEGQVRGGLRPFAAQVDTEAVLQEAFLRIWQVAPRFKSDGKPNALLRFTVTTARNVALGELRRSVPTLEQLDSLERELSAREHQAPVTPDPHLRSAVAECRRKLPKQPGQAMSQRLEAGHEDDATLAARVGMSLNTFLKNVTRARAFLAECLKRAGVDLASELTP